MSAQNKRLVDDQVLMAGVRRLDEARGWTPRAVANLEELIREGDDFDLFRINPFQYAEDQSLDEAEAIDLLLHAASAGLFELDWHLLCPACGDVVQSFDSLAKLSDRLSCRLCCTDMRANLDDYVEVSFTVQPEVRQIAAHDPGSLDVEDYFYRYHFSRTGHLADGRPFVDAMRDRCRHMGFIEPGARQSMEFDVSEGTVIVHDLAGDVGVYHPVEPGGAPSPAGASARIGASSLTVQPAAFRPGRVKLEVENHRSARGALIALQIPPGYSNATLEFAPFLTGNRLLSTQTFRTLFQFETVAQTDGIGIRDLTLLFTDLKASTQLYEEIGDLDAFALVQQHFSLLSREVEQHHGAVVKTIGDAVMSSFERPGDGAAAAVAMVEAVQRFNRRRGEVQLSLKVGLHRGAAIAVSQNGRPDYFGQTVNVAARVQGLADADEICVSESVYADPDARAVCGAHQVEPVQAALRGVSKPITVYRIGL